ncbi:hypothetical protein LTR17_002724 [Elasticomyces elasticus]|nr:hypothetical protein LTR17_002724 [Elasticomyces elasticus]
MTKAAGNRIQFGQAEASAWEGSPTMSDLCTSEHHGEDQSGLIRSGSLAVDDANQATLLVVRHVDIDVPLYPVTPMRIAGATPEMLQKAIHDFEAISVWEDEVLAVELTSRDRLPMGPRERQVPCFAHIGYGLTGIYYRSAKAKRPALADLPTKDSSDQVPSRLEAKSKGLVPSPRSSFALIANKENEHPNKHTSEQAPVRTLTGNHPSSLVQALTSKRVQHRQLDCVRHQW